MDTNDNQTALQISIQRNKNRLEYIKLCPVSDTTTAIKHELMDIITEDEKLLAEEREQLQDAFGEGEANVILGKAIVRKQWFNQKYGTDGK